MRDFQNKNDRTSSPDGNGNPSADLVGGRLQWTAGGVLENIENLDAPKKKLFSFPSVDEPIYWQAQQNKDETRPCILRFEPNQQDTKCTADQ